MRLARILFPASLPLALVLAACGGAEGQDPAAVRAGLTDTLPELLEQTSGAFAYLDESTALDGVSQSLAAIPSPFGVETAPLRGALTRVADGEEEDPAAALAEALFNADNYEGDGVYRVPADLLCPSDEAGAIDAECAANVAAAELRVRVTGADGGLDFTLIVGPDRDEPATLELRAASVALAVDLGEARSAAVFIAGLAGETVDLPETMTGEVAVTLAILGEKHVRADLTVREAVEIGGTSDEGPVSFTTGAALVAALELDAVARQIGVEVDLGATSLDAPWSMLDGESLASGVLHLDLGGLSGKATVTEGDEGITLEDLGIGDGLTVALDDDVLIAASVVPFAVTITPTAGGLPTIALAPGFDLNLLTDLTPLAAAGDEVESYLIDQTYRIELSGSGPEVQSIAPSVEGGDDGALAVLGGELTLSSTAAADPVVVAAGACLLGSPVEAGEHPIIGAFTAGDCP